MLSPAFKLYLFIIIIGISTISCGYRPLLSSSRKVDVLYLPVVINGTSYSNIASQLTTMLRGEIRSSGIGIHEHKQKNAWGLSVKIAGVRGSSDAIKIKSGEELPVTALWRIDAMVTLFKPDGNMQIKPTLVTVQDVAPAGDNLNSELLQQERTRSALLERLAKKITFMILQVQ